MSLKKMILMINNHNHKLGIRWKINIKIATMLIVLTMIAIMGQCVDNGVTNDANDDSITDNS